MFNNLMNQEVLVMVTSKGESVFEYSGVLCEENETAIKLKNAEINIAMLNFQKNIFGGSVGSYKQNIEEIVINKRYIISCSKR